MSSALGFADGNVAVQDERFELKKQKYHGQQYSQLYVFRLRHAKQHLLPLVKKRWPTLPGNARTRSP